LFYADFNKIHGKATLTLSSVVLSVHIIVVVTSIWYLPNNIQNT